MIDVSSIQIAEAHNLKIVLILTVGFALAGLLGYLSQRLKLSPILGYLLAGYLIGPYSPGFVAEMQLSEELAEIGVVLMMFGVGLHFKWQELMSVKNVAIPGAIIQTVMATIVSALLIYSVGWPLEVGVIIGLAIGVASTVVLVRVLSDNNLLATPQGHIAVGWLIVEDVLTIAALILLPSIAEFIKGGTISVQSIALSVVLIVVKFTVLIALMFTLGRRFVTYALFKIARTRSHELFTLTVLALIFVIATGSALLFGTSIALGAFIAGMVVGQTEARHQALANSLPMKDAFVVIFFLSVGMLFNPFAMFEFFPLFISVLAVVLIVKPLVALLLVLAMRYPLKVALTIALALAQIGEFSFILAEEASNLKILPDEGYDVIVACALISISINPLLFKLIDYFEPYLSRANSSMAAADHKLSALVPAKKALVIGFGPIGQMATEALEKIGFSSVIIDRNVDTISHLRKDESRLAIYGDASIPSILETAAIQTATFLVVTIPDSEVAALTIKMALHLNPELQVLARARYQTDKALLTNLGVECVCCEEEAGKAFANAILKMGTVREELPAPKPL